MTHSHSHKRLATVAIAALAPTVATGLAFAGLLALRCAITTAECKFNAGAPPYLNVAIVILFFAVIGFVLSIPLFVFVLFFGQLSLVKKKVSSLVAACLGPPLVLYSFGLIQGASFDAWLIDPWTYISTFVCGMFGWIAMHTVTRFRKSGSE